MKLPLQNHNVKDAKLQLRVPADVAFALAERARQQDVSLSHVVRVALREHLANTRSAK